MEMSLPNPMARMSFACSGWFFVHGQAFDQAPSRSSKSQLQAALVDSRRTGPFLTFGRATSVNCARLKALLNSAGVATALFPTHLGKKTFSSVEEQAHANLLPCSLHKRGKPSKALVQHDARLQAIRAAQRQMEQPLQPYSITDQSSSPSVPVSLQINSPDINFDL